MIYINVGNFTNISIYFSGELARYWKPLPTTILGIPLIISGALTIWIVPETLNSELPQTLKKLSEPKKTTDDVELNLLKENRNK